MENDLSILPSVIILKNSIVEGRIPQKEDLEVGEVALQLYQGEEDLFAKNSNGDVISLRTPREDLFWGDLFLKYDSLEDFQNDLDNNKIKDTSIVYINGDNPTIWTGGVFYSTNYTSDGIEQYLEKKLILLPDKVFKLESSDNSNTISEAFNGPENFTDIINRSIDSNSISMISLPDGGIAPVSIIPKVISLTHSELRIEWLSYGNYTIEIVKLLDGIFTVQKDIIDFSNYSDLKKKVDNIYDFNKELVTPKITGSWSIYNQDEELEKQYTGDTFSKNIIIEDGFKVKFTGTFSWESEEGKKNPQNIVSGNWSTLPGDGIPSTVYESNYLTTDTTISIKVSAPKTGLVVKGSNVILASGDDYSQDQITLSFIPSKSYWGIVTKSGITENDIIHLSNSEEKTNNTLTINSVSLGSTEYFVYSYPTEFGDLETITQDGVQPVLGAFQKKVMNITNNSGKSISMNVYITNNPGAFTESELTFK